MDRQKMWWQKALEKRVSGRQMCRILGIIFVLTSIPLFVVGLFNAPAIDDFYYSVQTMPVFRQTSSVIQTIAATFAQVADTYLNWQGSYAAVFLFALHPAVFGEAWYAVCTFHLLGSLLAASWLFSWVLFCRVLKVDCTCWLAVTLITLLLGIHLVPSPVQSYYWWNGSIYYTFFYSLSLVFFSLVFLGLNASKKTKWFYLLGQVVLAFLLGGGNMVTALFSLVVLVLLMGGLVIRRDQRVWQLVLPLLIFASGFAVNILSPGNALRAESYPNAPGVIKAIELSFYYALRSIQQWMTPAVAIPLAVLFPVLARAAGRTRFSFCYPLLFSLGTFTVYATQYTPPVYAMGSAGEERIADIIWYAFLWLCVANLFYWGGWIARRGVYFESVIESMKIRRNTIVLFLLMTLSAVLPVTGEGENFEWWHGRECAGINALYSLQTGEMQTYARECRERWAILQDETVQNVVFHPFSKTPYLLFYGDLTQDPDYEWSNDPIRRCYNKQSVIVLWQ